MTGLWLEKVSAWLAALALIAGLLAVASVLLALAGHRAGERSADAFASISVGFMFIGVIIQVAAVKRRFGNLPPPIKLYQHCGRKVRLIGMSLIALGSMTFALGTIHRVLIEHTSYAELLQLIGISVAMSAICFGQAAAVICMPRYMREAIR